MHERMHACMHACMLARAARIPSLVGRTPVWVISKFPLLILNKNRWSTNYIPTLVSTELVEVFLPLGLNHVQGLILGLVFQVGG
jgi:hypothetical protein